MSETPQKRSELELEEALYCGGPAVAPEARQAQQIKAAFMAGYAARPADGKRGWNELDGVPREWVFDVGRSSAGDLAEDAYRAWLEVPHA